MNTTIEDIRNDARKSGFDHVSESRPGPNGHRGSLRYRAYAYGGTLDKSGRAWQSSLRRTAIEAAQDYCDYVNGQNVVIYTQRRGRPDGFVTGDGRIHLDVPGETTNPVKRVLTRRAPERDLILNHMLPAMQQFAQPLDIWEAKANTGRQALATAVGQLRRRWYEAHHIGRMVLYLPEFPSSEAIDWLWFESVNICAAEGGWLLADSR